ncbi:MAG: hypothetical protein PWP52_1697, partial [Bacteroidales bacterium]|nr:hypothetical protein [Bacteroidales bacterium]
MIEMKNLSKHQYLGKIPEWYNEFYNVSFFGTDRIFYKPLKVTYNNEYIFYIYRPSVKYFLEKFASKYSKEEKKEVYNSISQGYNIGVKEYNNTFDLTETGAKRLLNELERLQKIPFKETHVNFAELKKCGEIEGRINCIYGIMDSNYDLFFTYEIKKVDSLKTQNILALYLALTKQELPKDKEGYDLLMDKYKIPRSTGKNKRYYHTFKTDYSNYKHPRYRQELFTKTTEVNLLEKYELILKYCESNNLPEHKDIVEREYEDYK